MDYSNPNVDDDQDSNHGSSIFYTVLYYLRKFSPLLFILGFTILGVFLAIYIPFISHSQNENLLVITSVDDSDHYLQDLNNYCIVLKEGANAYVGTLQRESLTRALNNLSDKTIELFVNLRVALSRDYLRFGDTAKANELLEEALEKLETQDSLYGPTKKAELFEALAITNLKRGELDNCLTPSGSLVCSLPLDKSIFQKNQHGSIAAINYLSQWLNIEPNNMKAIWLLNIAHMTLGTYPEEVPAGYIIPIHKLETDHPFPKFEEISHAAGLYKMGLAGGSIIEDFDNDGFLDIVVSSWDPCESISYFHNDRNGTFTDYTISAGLAGQLGGLNIVQTDYNNDGWADIFIMRGGWMQQDGQMRMSLIRNNKNGTFTDITHEAGLAFPEYPSQSASWGDYDNDGDLDLFSCNESARALAEGGISDIQYPSQLFRNNNNGTFTDVAKYSGVTNLRYCKSAIWGDYNGDNAPDLYISNFGAENRLYRNNNDGTFTDVALELSVTEPINSFATWFWDYNNDGNLDIFVAGYGTNVADVAADYLDIPNEGAKPRLYRNDGFGNFTDVTKETGIYRVHLAMGANFGDLDNDGFNDFYLGTGAPLFDAVTPNIMYKNYHGDKFIDVTFAGGFGHLQKGHGVAFGDLDRDGDQDIFLQIGGFFPGDGFSNALYENPGHGNNWITIKLIGTQSNTAAIGAKIKILIEDQIGNRSIYATVNSGGSFGSSSLQQEIGLGNADYIKYIEVYWPSTGTTQRFIDVPMNSRIEIHEGDSSFKLLNKSAFLLR